MTQTRLRAKQFIKSGVIGMTGLILLVVYSITVIKEWQRALGSIVLQCALGVVNSFSIIEDVLDLCGCFCTIGILTCTRSIDLVF